VAARRRPFRCFPAGGEKLLYEADAFVHCRGGILPDGNAPVAEQASGSAVESRQLDVGRVGMHRRKSKDEVGMPERFPYEAVTDSKNAGTR
jgi:hypothetical protein